MKVTLHVLIWPLSPSSFKSELAARGNSAVAAGLPTVVKLVDKETLLKEREEKKKVSRKQIFFGLGLITHNLFFGPYNALICVWLVSHRVHNTRHLVSSRDNQLSLKSFLSSF